MRLWLSRLSQTCVLVIAGLVSLTVPVGAQVSLRGHELVAALQQGGYVIYFRHGGTDRSQVDTAREDILTWSTQRNLSAAGRAQAHAIGRAIHRLGIPVSEILTSPYCRCVETGWLLFGKSVVTEDLASAIGEDELDAKRLGAALRRLLGVPPAAGTNTVLIGHTANLKEAANVWPQPEGVTIVFRPLGNGDFTFVGRLEPQEWPTLAGLHEQDRGGDNVASDGNRPEVAVFDRNMWCNRTAPIGAQLHP